MTLEYLAVLVVIAVFSAVQSIFGLGVLVFGTPTLLLMGYDFIGTLGYLLPASFAISLLQVLFAGQSRVPVSRYLYTLSLPGIGVGLWLAESSGLASSANVLIGGMLLLSALVRFWPTARRLSNALLESHFSTYHLLMGVAHGLTNLGGAMLALLASGTHTKKQAIRYTVAHYYLVFSTVQMLLLATIMGHHEILLVGLPTAIVSALVYLLVGNWLFIRTTNPIYDRYLTIFIAIYGAVVLVGR